jgi:hypothetical protein
MEGILCDTSILILELLQVDIFQAFDERFDAALCKSRNVTKFFKPAFRLAGNAVFNGTKVLAPRISSIIVNTLADLIAIIIRPGVHPTVATDTHFDVHGFQKHVIHGYESIKCIQLVITGILR